MIHISDYETYFILPLSEPFSLNMHSLLPLRRSQNNVPSFSVSFSGYCYSQANLTAQVTQRIQVTLFSFTPQCFSPLSMSHCQILPSCRIMSTGIQGLMEGSQMIPTNRKVQKSGCETGVLFTMLGGGSMQ